MLDDEAARRRLLEAASRCISRRGNTQVRMAEVAEEAGVVRSTLYRYFANRDELLLGLLIMRTDIAIAALVSSLWQPEDAAQSIPELILGPVNLVQGNPLNEALFAPESTASTSALESGAESVIDVLLRHFGPLLQNWQTSGQLHADLDQRETVRWMQSAWLYLLSPAWRPRSAEDKRRFVEQYLVRALVSSR
ncbi:MAG TPA: helix-turn-helix domain-containing protein [Mycobacterium sp.]|nr:helix-turn-helix domain-containing protein [Mycobacterium sp.]